VPPGQSKLRVLHTDEGVTLTDKPDPARLTSESNGKPVLGSSCLPTAFRRSGLLVVGFGVVLLVDSLIRIVFFNTPLQINGRVAGKMEAVLTQLGFLAFFLAFGAVWYFVAGKIFPEPRRYWRLDLGDDDWVLRQGDFRWVRRRVSPREILGLVVDRQGRVVAETTAGKRLTITGPMEPFESAWAAQALSGQLGLSAGAGPGVDSTRYACVPTLEPPAEPGSTLKYRLSRSDQPWNRALGCLAVTLLWNGVTWVFVWVQIHGGIDPRSAGWKAWLILTPSILIGLGLLALLVWSLLQAIYDMRAGTTVVEISMHPLEPGKPCKLFFSSQGQSELPPMVVRLVCEEQVKYGTGEDTGSESKRVRELEVYHGDGLPSVAGLPVETTFEFEVPADAMHSLELKNNKISWRLEMEGGPGDPPRFHREFAIVVNPPRSSGARS
jgi:hypothetical protein